MWTFFFRSAEDQAVSDRLLYQERDKDSAEVVTDGPSEKCDPDQSWGLGTLPCQLCHAHYDLKLLFFYTFVIIFLYVITALRFYFKM